MSAWTATEPVIAQGAVVSVTPNFAAPACRVADQDQKLIHVKDNFAAPANKLATLALAELASAPLANQAVTTVLAACANTPGLVCRRSRPQAHWL